MSESQTIPGWTVPALARRYRVGEDKVRGWIRRGELAAINTAPTSSGKPRFVVTPEAVKAFEEKRAAADPSKQQGRQSRRRPLRYDNANPKADVEYFPDNPAEKSLVKLYTRQQISREELAKRVRELRRFQAKKAQGSDS